MVVVDVPDDVGLAPVVVFFLEEVIPPRNVERVVVLHVRGTVVIAGLKRCCLVFFCLVVFRSYFVTDFEK